MLIAKESSSQTNGKRFHMDLQFPAFQQLIRERNEIARVALECAAFVLSRAHTLPLEQQRPMMGLLKELISLQEEEGDLPEANDLQGPTRLLFPPRIVVHLESSS